jgi:hypothetical protein
LPIDSGFRVKQSGGRRMNKTEKKKTGFLRLLKGIGIIIFALMAADYIIGSNVITYVIEKISPAIDSTPNKKNMDSTASIELSDEELAWHAVNTYRWDCDEIVSRGSMSNAEYYSVTCSNGKILRVYPRQYTYPRITNKSGGND